MRWFGCQVKTCMNDLWKSGGGEGGDGRHTVAKELVEEEGSLNGREGGDGELRHLLHDVGRLELHQRLLVLELGRHQLNDAHEAQRVLPLVARRPGPAAPSSAVVRRRRGSDMTGARALPPFDASPPPPPGRGRGRCGGKIGLLSLLSSASRQRRSSAALRTRGSSSASRLLITNIYIPFVDRPAQIELHHQIDRVHRIRPCCVSIGWLVDWLE